MRFVLFDSVITKECSIRKSWKAHRRHGLRLFGWHFLIMAVSSAGFLIIVAFPLGAAWALGWFSHPRDHLIAIVSGGLVFFCVTAGFVLIMILIQVLTKDFVVPQMALENLSAMEGWRRLWSWLRVEKAGYAGYIGMKAVLAIAAGVFLAIIIVIALLAFIIPVVAIRVFAGLSGIIGLTWTLSTIILAVVAALIAFAICMFVISFISVPAIVFFPAYSMYFLAPRYPPLAAVLWTGAGADVPQPSAPAEPPPWSPAPV
jgi:hypothetical protein